MNMNDDKINTLAREYADECIDPQGFSKDTYEEMVEDKAENVAYLLRWLCDRFYLVEKNKAITAYNAMSDYGKNKGVECAECANYAARIWMRRLFSEIAKEVSHG